MNLIQAYRGLPEFDPGGNNSELIEGLLAHSRLAEDSARRIHRHMAICWLLPHARSSGETEEIAETLFLIAAVSRRTARNLSIYDANAARKKLRGGAVL